MRPDLIYKTAFLKGIPSMKKVFYYMGLTLSFIIFIPYFRKYEISKKLINKSIEFAEKSKILFMKSFFIGISANFIAEAFFSADEISKTIPKKKYVKFFIKELDKFKSKTFDNEITESVKNYFKVENIQNSIEKLYEIHIHLIDRKMEIRTQCLTDYLFINEIVNSLYSSIMLF